MPGCKPGDLAIVTKSKVQAGLIVKVIRQASGRELLECLIERYGYLFTAVKDGLLWEVDQEMAIFRNMETGDIFSSPYYFDECLFPLRGDLLSEEEKRDMKVVA